MVMKTNAGENKDINLIFFSYTSSYKVIVEYVVLQNHNNRTVYKWNEYRYTFYF